MLRAGGVTTLSAAAVALLGCDEGGEENGTPSTGGTGTPSGAGGAGPTDGGSSPAMEAPADPVELDVELGEFYVSPSRIEVASGAPVVLTVTNAGVLPHDLRVDDTGTPMLDPGQSDAVTFGPFTQSAQLICTVPGHAAAGMIMEIVVSNGEPHEGEYTGPRPGDTGAAAAALDPNAEPGPDWQPRDPALPATPGATLHQVTFRMTEIQAEVAPGVMQEVWTFEDQVPGPVLRGKVGDIFEVTIVNDGVLGHSIDFHASKVAWNNEMRTIGPGEELLYRFEAKHSGVFQYHCGTAPTLHHIGNGMYGAVVIDPPTLEPVDREYLFVQSEFYLGPAGEPGDLRKMQNDQWDLVVFNGYFNQYYYAPIRIEANERVRAWVQNVGPSENCSFHIVGTVFDTVYKEGAFLLRPDENMGGAQALDLQPAQGGFVEFTMDFDGFYPIVTHKFSNVGKGALGLFQAGDVDPVDAAH